MKLTKEVNHACLLFVILLYTILHQKSFWLKKRFADFLSLVKDGVGKYILKDSLKKIRQGAE